MAVMKNRLLLSLLTTCLNCYLALNKTILAVYCEAVLENGRRVYIYTCRVGQYENKTN